MNVPERSSASGSITGRGFSTGFSTSFSTNVHDLGGSRQTVDSATASLTCEDESLFWSQTALQLVSFPGYLPGVPPRTEETGERSARAGSQGFATSFSTKVPQHDPKQHRVGVRKGLLTSGLNFEGHCCTFCTAHCEICHVIVNS
jgi:hypothetical protein